MENNKEIAAALGYKLVDESATAETVEAVNVEDSKINEGAALSETVDAPIEKSDTTTDSSEVTQETKTESPSFEELLLEKSGGKFKTYEDLEKTFNEKPQENKSTEFANEQLEVLNRYVKDGGNIEDFLKTQVDYSKMSEMDVIKAEMKLADPDLSDSDMDFLINKEYQLDEDEYDEDDVRLSKIKLRKNARKAKASLKEWQDNYVIPENNNSIKPEQQAEENNQINQEASRKETERWGREVSESASKMETIDFEINENGDKFSFALSDNDRQNMVKNTSDLSKFWSKFMNGDGTENVDKLNKTMFIVDNFDKIIRTSFSKAKSEGKDSILKDIKNPNYSADSKVDSSGVGSLQEQMYAAWKQDN